MPNFTPNDLFSVWLESCTFQESEIEQLEHDKKELMEQMKKAAVRPDTKNLSTVSDPQHKGEHVFR